MANSIKALREAAGFTQGTFARKMDVDPQTIWRWENETRTPKWKDIQKMCEIFNCTSDELMSQPGPVNHTPAPAINGLRAGADSQDKPTPHEIAAEIAEFRDAINDLFPELADRDAYADILLDLKDNGRIDAPEMRAKIERGIRALEASLV